MKINVVFHILLAATATLLSGCGTEGSEPGGSNTSSQSSSSSSSSPTVNANLARIVNGYSVIPDGRGSFNIEAMTYTTQMGVDKEESLEAFKNTLYPILRTNCAACHSTINPTGAGAQAPLHADQNPALAHEYALTRVNFHEPETSKLVERLSIDRHNCFGNSCADAAEQIYTAIEQWGDAIEHMLTEVPRTVSEFKTFSEAEIIEAIAADRGRLSSSDREFVQYTSFHELHNDGVSAQNLNHARIALSKMLNSVARWAPEIVNPVDVTGEGIIYRFDIRDYWGWTGIDTSSNNFSLFFGGSDDDLASGNKVDVNGNRVDFNDLAEMRNEIKPFITRDDKFARLVWERILKGNAEAAGGGASAEPNIDGFRGRRQTGPNGQEFIAPESFSYVEAGQLVFTLSRPDVYAAIMALPGYANFLEEEIGVDISRGADSFDYIVTYEAITIDARMYWRAEQDTGRGDYYWKSFDVLTQGQNDINEIYESRNQRFPFWANPIPKFVSNRIGTTRRSSFSMVATINEDAGDFGRFDGSDGAQQSAEEVIWSFPNGMQGYALFGGLNQRRIDAFTNIVRDPRLNLDVTDYELDNITGEGRFVGIDDVRLNNGASCIGCHVDGMNRSNNDLRDWLDENSPLMPSGPFGADAWRNDPEIVARVRELYPPSTETRALQEKDRAVFLEAMAEVKEMAIGPDKNTYVEPIIWLNEWARAHYNYPFTRSN